MITVQALLTTPIAVPFVTITLQQPTLRGRYKQGVGTEIAESVHSTRTVSENEIRNDSC